MSASGESKKEVFRPDFNLSIMMDLQGAKLSSDAGFLLMRELALHQWPRRLRTIGLLSIPSTPRNK